MNTEKQKMILDLINKNPNQYGYGKDLTGKFVENGAEELKRRYKVKDKTISFYHRDIEFGSIRGLLPGSTSKIAYRICKDKFVTEKYLENMGIPVLSSKFFKEGELEDIKNYLQDKRNENFVLKPLSLGSGKGIIFNINIDNIEEAYKKSLTIQKEKNIIDPSFILQRYIDSFDVRICIVEGKFSCALWRVQPHVIGDGFSTVRELINKKNNIRKQSVYFKNFIYEINEALHNHLSSQDEAIDSIPKKDKIVYLSNLGNLAAGAESIDITHEVSKDLINIAVKAVATIPGLHTAGVDILTESIKSDTGYVSEINTNANFKVHYLPYYGEVQKPYKDMIENMFIKYKVNSGYNLDQGERRIYRQIATFNEYREFYHNKLGKLLLENKNVENYY